MWNCSQSKRFKSTNNFSTTRCTAGVVLLGSPILAAEHLTEQNPLSEVIFLSGKAFGYLTERIFENEAGQSMMLGLFILSLGAASLYFHGITKHTVRRMQIHQATKFGQLGHPYYTSKVLPPNPLIKDVSPKL